MRKSIQSVFPITTGTAFKNSIIQLTNHSILYHIFAPVLLPLAIPHSALKGNPVQNRSCPAAVNLARRAVQTLTATVL